MAETLHREAAERLIVPDTFEELMDIWEAEPYTRFSSNEPYKVGEGDGTKEERDRVKKAFIAGDVENPEVSYPNLDADELSEARDRMAGILERANTMPDSIDKDLARQLMRRKLAELSRHLEIAAAWATDDPEERQEHLDRAAEIQMEIFGAPEQDDFDHMLHGLRTKAEAVAEDHEGDTVKRAAAELLDLTGERDEPENFVPAGLTADERAVLKRDIESRRLIEDELLGVNVAAGEMPHDRARLLFRLIQEATGMQAGGWDTRLTDGSAAEMSRRNRSVNIGRGRKAYTPASLRLNEIHEGGHARRAFNGDRLAQLRDKPMARYALPDSLDFEEGLFVAMEQIVGETERVPGEQYYLAAGLMLGMDKDGEQRDFRKTYEVMWRRGVVEAASKGEKPNIDKIKGAAYQTMMRMTRGGALDTRDLSYYRGYVKATRWLHDVAKKPFFARSAEWHYVMSAQFDPTNPLHAAYIKR